MFEVFLLYVHPSRWHRVGIVTYRFSIFSWGCKQSNLSSFVIRLQIYNFLFVAPNADSLFVLFLWCWAHIPRITWLIFWKMSLVFGKKSVVFLEMSLVFGKMSVIFWGMSVVSFVSCAELCIKAKWICDTQNALLRLWQWWCWEVWISSLSLPLARARVHV